MQLRQLKTYGKYFFKSILEIIEDQPNYSVPLKVYIMLIIWHFIQVTGYLYSDEVRIIVNEYNKLVVLIEYISTFTYLLFYKENNNLIIFIFALMQVIMYFYFIYVGFITYMKLNHEQWLLVNKEMLSSVNHFLNTFFILYQWVFFIPYFEINSGTTICSPQCFFADQRDDAQCTLPLQQTVFSIIGNILSILTSLIIIFFFRNYEFNERNLLKRRYHFILLPQLIIYFIIIFFTFANPLSLALKYVCLQIIVISLMYDLLWNLPFRNPIIIKTYAVSIIFFEITSIIYTYLIFNPQLSDDEMLYQIFILGSLCSSVLMVSWYYRYEKVMKLNEKNFDNYSNLILLNLWYKKLNYYNFCFFKQRMFRYLDFYLEEIFRLSQLAESDKYSKYKLQEVVLSHQEFCTNQLCSCHNINIKETRQGITQNDILHLIESIFSWSLKQNILRKDKSQMEHLSLKYISFVAKYLNNSTSAYYELKILAQQEKQKSFYFESISEILQRNIQMLMEERIQREALVQSDTTGLNNREALKNFSEQDKATDVFIPIFVKFIQNKIDFWNKIKDPSLTLKSLNCHVISLSERCQEIVKIFSSYFQNQNISHWSTNIINLKILSIYKGIIQNQIGLSKIYEQSASEIMKKDIDRNEETLTNFNLMCGNILFVLVSIARNRGKILNTNKEKILSFFGYNKSEEHQVEDLNQLMPVLFSSVHKELMFNFIHKGYSHLFNGNHYTFAKNKQGFLFPVKIQIDYMNNFNDDFVLNGCIMKYNTSNQHILFDENGIIEGITEEIHSILLNEASFAQCKQEIQQIQFSRKLNILLLIPQLADILEKRKIQEEKRLSINMNLSQDKHSYQHQISDSGITQEKITIKIPKNLSNLAKQFNNLSKKSNYPDKSQLNSSQNSFSRLHSNHISDETSPITIFKQFQLLFSKNKSQWEYFNSKHIPITCNLELKTLSILSDRKRNFNLHKIYYVLTITDIDLVSRSPKSDPILEDHSSNQKKIMKQPDKDQCSQRDNINSVNLSNLLTMQSPITGPLEINKQNGIGSNLYSDPNLLGELYHQLPPLSLDQLHLDNQLSVKQDLINFSNSKIDLAEESNNQEAKKLTKMNGNGKRKNKISFDENTIINHQNKIGQIDSRQQNYQEDKQYLEEQHSDSIIDIQDNQENGINEDHQLNIQQFQQQVDRNRLYFANFNDQTQTPISPQTNTQAFSSHNFIITPLANQNVQINFALESDRLQDQVLTNRYESIETKKLIQEEQLHQNIQNKEIPLSQSCKDEPPSVSSPSLNKIEQIQENKKLQRKKTLVQKSKQIITQNIGIMNYYIKTLKNKSEDGEDIEKQSTEQNASPMHRKEIGKEQSQKNHDHTSLSSYRSSLKVFDNDAIQTIVQQKRPSVLKSFNLLLGNIC